MEKPRLLVISPHPDDESFYFGGTLIKYAPLAQIYLLFLTRGEKGKLSLSKGERIITTTTEPETLAELRTKEALIATNILGIPEEQVIFERLPDSGINEKAISVIALSIIRINPHLIISFDEAGTTRPSNTDHSWSGIATFAAIKLILERDRGNLAFRRWLTYNLPQPERFLSEYAAFQIPPEELIAVDVTEVIPRKLEACQQYRTQSHLFQYFYSVGLLSLPVEYFRERISRTGTDKILFELNNPPKKITFTTSFPDSEEIFSSTDPNFYQKILINYQITLEEVTRLMDPCRHGEESGFLSLSQ